MKENIEFDSLISINSISDSNHILIESFKSLLPSSKESFKKQFIKYLIFLIFSTIVSLSLSNSQSIVLTFLPIVEFINNIIIAMLGIVFTGYALFQAVLSEKIIRLLLSTRDVVRGGQVKTRFERLNNSFFFLIVLYSFTIILNLLIFMVLNTIDFDLVNRFGNEILMIWLTRTFFLFYFFYCLILIWSIKSFIFNLFSLLNSSVILKGIKMMNESIGDKGLNED